MSLSEKIVTEVTPAGSISAITWKSFQLRRMLLPERSLVKIPNRNWDVFTYPFDLMEDVVNASAARVTFHVHVPPYQHDLTERIARRLQQIFYDISERAEDHRKAAVKTLIQTISKKSPQLFLAGDVISISNYETDYVQAVRFTSWSQIPAELLQIRIIWDEETNLLNRINEVEIDLIFDQRKINPDFGLKVNRRGLLHFNETKWIFSFDLNKIRNKEIPTLDKLQTPPLEHVISSDNTSPENENPRPKKRIRLMNRFMISSDEE